MTGWWYRYPARWNLNRDDHRRMQLNGTFGTQAAHLIGVSVPRSGHNLVVRLLQALLADDLFYCERYLVAGCCQTMPCARRGTRQITFQKSHDLELDDPRDVADACYVIQHRAPVPAILSAREKYAEEFGEAMAADRGAYAVWLGQQAHYLVSFYERWIAEPPANGVVVDYDDLVASPADALRRIARAAGIEAAEEQLQAAVEATMPRGGQFGECPFVPRSIDESRYLDRELLPVFESIVIDALPAYAPKRVFEPVELRGTLVWYVFAALRAERAGDADEGIRLLDDALGRWPDNGMLLYEQSWRFLKQARYAEAQVLLERAAVLLPSHPPILNLLVTAALAAGDAPAALGPMRALATQVEPTIPNRLRLAKVLAHNHDRAGAAEILYEVANAAPQDAQVWRDISKVRLVRGELSEARLALETAIQLAPLRADLYNRHADVLMTLQKPSRAVDSLRRSLALDPGQKAAWVMLVEALRAADDRAAILQAVEEARARFPGDVEFQATMAETRSRALLAPPPVSPPPGSSKADRLVRHVTALVGRLPGGERIDRVRGRIVRRLRTQLGPREQDEMELAPLRAALGAAEQRLAETEQRMHQELEAAWSQAHSLEDALKTLDAALAEAIVERDAAWTQAERLDLALAEQTRDAEAAWTQARRLDAALAEQSRNAEAGWAQAQKLDAALAASDRALQAAYDEAQRLTQAVIDRDRRLQVAWEHAHRLDAALGEKDRELAMLRARLHRLERELDEATSGSRSAAWAG